MKIKTINASESYETLKDLKLSTIDENIMFDIWKDIKELRPIHETYKADIESLKQTLQDEKYDMMVARLSKARERENKVKNGEYSLTIEDKQDVIEINQYFEDFNKKGEAFFKELGEKEVEIDAHTIKEDEMLKILKLNDKDFNLMEKLAWVLSE